jgi:hypothetical protein
VGAGKASAQPFGCQRLEIVRPHDAIPQIPAARQASTSMSIWSLMGTPAKS